MIPIKFNKAIKKEYNDGVNEFSHWDVVDAFVAFEKFGFTWVVHEELEESKWGDFNCWEVSETTTGCRIPFDTPALTAQTAIDRASKFLDEKGEDLTKQKIAEAMALIQDIALEPTPAPPSVKPSVSESDQPQ